MQVNWFPEYLVSPPGKLGLTNLPGAREYSRDEDLDSLRNDGVNLILCLVEAHELDYLSPSETPQQRRTAVEQRKMKFMHHQIIDFNVPALEEANRTIQTVDEALSNGETVIMHCWAGLGRAGTMAACLLVHRGMSAADAISSVREVRPGAIQSAAQENFIQAFGQSD